MKFLIAISVLVIAMIMRSPKDKAEHKKPLVNLIPPVISRRAAVPSFVPYTFVWDAPCRSRSLHAVLRLKSPCVFPDNECFGHECNHSLAKGCFNLRLSDSNRLHLEPKAPTQTKPGFLTGRTTEP